MRMLRSLFRLITGAQCLAMTDARLSRRGIRYYCQRRHGHFGRHKDFVGRRFG